MRYHRALVIGLALTAALAAQAQDLSELSKAEPSRSREYTRRTLNFQKVETNYLVCLNSVIPGVVESALGHVTLMRIAYPKQEFSKIREKLYDLASQGATQTIRYKAFAAMQVFANPAAFRETIAISQVSGDGLLEDLVRNYSRF